jgi:hypothetical protein
MIALMPSVFAKASCNNKVRIKTKHFHSSGMLSFQHSRTVFRLSRAQCFELLNRRHAFTCPPLRLGCGFIPCCCFLSLNDSGSSHTCIDYDQGRRL